MPETQKLNAVLFVHFVGFIILADGATRVYYLGIREVDWNYAPLGRNAATGQSVANDQKASLFLQSTKNRIGSVYRKSVYKQYSDATYTSEEPKPAWLGFLGPIVQAEVGDTILIHLKNFGRRPFTIHPHGVFYKKDSEGSLYPDVSSQDLKKDDAVPPGGNYTYTWTVPEDHGPTADDPACLTWIYHSHINAPRDIATGLIGPLLICREGTLKSRSQRRYDADLDFFLMFSVVDENESWHLHENLASFCQEPDSVDEEDEEFKESNRMHAINGYVFGNLPEMTMCAGDHVSWHLFGMGSEVDVHTAFFHGQTLVVRGHRTDVVSLFPATFVAAEMTPHNTGKWLLSCAVHDHLQAGMEALYEVKNCSYLKPESPLKGKLRKYYIAAKEVQWNYGPSGLDQSTGKSLQEPNSFSEMYFKQSSTRIGGTYWKAKYTEYTDGSFRVEKERKEEEKHLGILGSSRRGSAVRPLGNFTYQWTVPQHVGPTATDPPCLTWMYSSATDPTRDTNSGLVGPLLVCRPGTLNERNQQKGVDKEFYVLFGVFNENLSWYRDANLKYLKHFPKQDKAFEEEAFMESNRMHAINGFMYGNLPLLEVCKGETVSWHLLGLGSETDVHGVAFQGNTVLMNGQRRDATNIFPHTFATALMQPDKEGPFIWAEVGDVLNIVFRNNASRPYSIHAHGIVEKDNRGSGTAKPGEIVTYQWEVPERSGPGPNDSTCVSWIYYSRVDPVKDLFSGLVGALKVCRKGALGLDGRRKGVSKEFALLFLVFDENQSWYLEENVKNYGQGKWNRSHGHDEEFVESNKMHAINGKLYANLPGLTMHEGDWVNWYLLGMGQEIDVHTSGKSYRADVVDLFPGTFEMVEMLAGNPGTWLLHCHVADHIHAGMETLFTVLPRPDVMLLNISSAAERPPEDDDDDDSHHIFLFGSKLAHGQVKATIILLVVAGIVLFLIASILLGVIIYRERQKRLRRNRRSILDESFKLMSTKTPEI
ncbi:hypothetical protein JD844_004213 [Phrynosoma platyrhinos]|uniref:ferroxidase n=1 Tax=Phrynosoma platyrhinos TaxID=52577 RepID=A0ABQ7TM61_PHRPL|nr:hypothetical protein JD844_004213 [Phrynosoma platyrhinos]